MAELEDSGMLKEWWANPAVVGLMGFGLTTMATGLHNVGYWSAGPTLALAITFGGTAQFIAGIVDLRKGSIFGGSAFMSYGAFWWSLFVLLYVQPKTGIPAGHPEELGFFLMWTLFTLAFCVAVQGVGKFLAVLFWLLLLAFVLAGLRGFRQVSGGGCGVGDLYRRPDRLVYRNGDVGEYSLQKEGSTTFLKSRIRVRKGASILWETRCLRPP